MTYDEYKEIQDLVDDRIQDQFTWLGLENTCPQCQGAKIIAVLPPGKKKKVKETCPKCSGNGYLVTSLGEQILEFVRRNLIPEKA